MRHECLRCGGSCQGLRVRVIDNAEGERIESLAAQLSISRPIVGGALRMNWGKCAFLDDKHRCRIHTEFGFVSKPVVCQQYPCVVAVVEGEERFGIDPGCFLAIRSWRDGPQVDGALRLQSPMPPALGAADRRLLAVLSGPRCSLKKVVRQLSGNSLGDFAGEARERFQGLPLDALLRQPESGPMLGQSLSGIVAVLQDEEPFPLSPKLGRQAEEYGLHCIHQMAYLGLFPRSSLRQAAIVTAAGVVLAAYADPAEDAFGAAIAAWCRILRAPPVLALLK